MESIILKNGRIIDWEKEEIVRADVRIENQIIMEIGSELASDGVTVIDVEGRLISHGLIDLHVHLREPGFEAKETIESGTMSAARGGFTAVACMPNTRPVTDCPEVIEAILQQTEKKGAVRVYPLAAISKNELGRELTNMEALQEAGAIAFSDDGVGVQSSHMMKEAMRMASRLGLPVVAHCEDNTLAHGGCVHEGTFSAKYGLKGIPNTAESVHVGRDILLAEDTGVHYHVCHISAKESVRLVREAKARGQKVTAEVTPHHLLLSDEDIPEPSAQYKMNPPLRAPEDRAAVLEGLKDGTIDVIVTDHAPHTVEEKAQSMSLAPFGIVGLETAFPLLYTHLVERGELSLLQLIDCMTRKPAELFSLGDGQCRVGAIADLTVIDLEEEREIDPEQFLSKGRNTPFTGWKVKGWPVMTMVDGKVVWQEEGWNRGGEQA
ncbi:dihydroorotase [Mechercharimyces sp. CAU 1602]|uniref:dihydroorotase n=1 Tax=Mechercharimyces sp. CAU 1602 TaxID=2973933 RepID=UPI002162FEA7|nr:dihydroorotase [Mechercharimyces sp. CAU 1602]MCS1350649.1 dihydroorotase [Mechercharimyces sp. CAU 1602]